MRAGPHVADFKEKGGATDFQSIGIEVVEKYLFGKRDAVKFGKFAVDEVELCIGKKRLDVTDRVAEGGFLAFKVVDDLGQVEKLALRLLQ